MHRPAGEPVRRGQGGRRADRPTTILRRGVPAGARRAGLDDDAGAPYQRRCSRTRAPAGFAPLDVAGRRRPLAVGRRTPAGEPTRRGPATRCWTRRTTRPRARLAARLRAGRRPPGDRGGRQGRRSRRGAAGRPGLQPWSGRSPRGPEVPGDPPGYLSVALVGDTTAGLRRDGVVSLQLPAAALARIGFAPPDEATSPGSASTRPPLEPARAGGVVLAARLPRARARPRSAGCAGSAPTPRTSSRRADARPELLGTGTGERSQELATRQRPGGARLAAGRGRARPTRWVRVDGGRLAGAASAGRPPAPARPRGRRGCAAATACAGGRCRLGAAGPGRSATGYGGGRGRATSPRRRSPSLDVPGGDRRPTRCRRVAARTPSRWPRRSTASPASCAGTTAR